MKPSETCGIINGEHFAPLKRRLRDLQSLTDQISFNETMRPSFTALPNASHPEPASRNDRSMSDFQLNANEIYQLVMSRDESTSIEELLDRFCSDRPDVRREVPEMCEASNSNSESQPQSIRNGTSESKPSLEQVEISNQDSLEAPFSDSTFLNDETSNETDELETQLCPYRRLPKLGVSGMGGVYLAEQKRPVRRRVAVKVIKPGMDSKQVLTRFESQRQALALMEHPAIARVLDAGTTRLTNNTRVSTLKTIHSVF